MKGIIWSKPIYMELTFLPMVIFRILTWGWNILNQGRESVFFGEKPISRKSVILYFVYYVFCRQHWILSIHKAWNVLFWLALFYFVMDCWSITFLASSLIPNASKTDIALLYFPIGFSNWGLQTFVLILSCTLLIPKSSALLHQNF